MKPDNGRPSRSTGSSQAHGRAGENLACKFLESRDYSIIETNYRSRYGEIDIIARRGGVIAFVEVKTRLGRGHGEPFEAVGARKQAQIRRMAEMWLAGHRRDRALSECVFRFDVISVKMDGRSPAGGKANFDGSEGTRPAGVKKIPGIEHIEDAFR